MNRVEAIKIVQDSLDIKPVMIRSQVMVDNVMEMMMTAGDYEDYVRNDLIGHISHEISKKAVFETFREPSDLGGTITRTSFVVFTPQEFREYQEAIINKLINHTEIKYGN